MKKLIVFSVIFALLVPAVFAADIGIEVFGGVRVLEGTDQENGPVGGSGGMTRLRVEGSGENGDGTFGAWYRLDSGGGTQGMAWWKPIDQFKLSIGGNSDGIWGTEGIVGWMFYQMPSEIDVVAPGSVWGWGGYGPFDNGAYSYRDVFFGGHGGDGLILEITPVNEVGINVSLPFFNGGNILDYNAGDKEYEIGKILSEVVAQVNLNLDFGNIALTYKGAQAVSTDLDSAPTVFAALDLTAVDGLGLNFGISYKFGTQDTSDPDYKVTRTNPLGVGLGVKYDVNDDFGFKVRAVALLGASTEYKYSGETVTAKDPLILGVDLLPYYALSDNLKAFLGLGITAMAYDSDYKWEDGKDYGTDLGFHVNPYLQIGAEWGPTFYVGFRLWTNGFRSWEADETDPTKGKVVNDTLNWAVPIGLVVSF